MRLLARWFVQGLLVLLPMTVTVLAVSWIVTHVFVRLDHLFPVPTPGLGFGLAIASIILVGALFSNVFGRWIVRLTERLLAHLPLVGTLYRTVKDVVQSLVGEKKTFDRPVVVTLAPGGTAKVLGFVTRDDLGDLGLPGEVAVLLQQSFGFCGNLLVFPKSQVRSLPVDSARFLTFIMSGGLAGAAGTGTTTFRPS